MEYEVVDVSIGLRFASRQIGCTATAVVGAAKALGCNHAAKSMLCRMDGDGSSSFQQPPIDCERDQSPIKRLKDTGQQIFIVYNHLLVSLNNLSRALGRPTAIGHSSPFSAIPYSNCRIRRVL